MSAPATTLQHPLFTAPPPAIEPATLAPAPVSKRTTEQTFSPAPRLFKVDHIPHRLTITVRYDDSMRNGHNTFTVTGRVDTVVRGQWQVESCGMLHSTIAKHYPELTHLLKWHGCTSVEPLHYVANTLYWLGWKGGQGSPLDAPPRLDYARTAAIWPELPEHMMLLALPTHTTPEHAKRCMHIEAALTERLPALMAEFRDMLECQGFVY
jgi:hypothetical protein